MQMEWSVGCNWEGNPVEWKGWESGEGLWIAAGKKKKKKEHGSHYDMHGSMYLCIIFLLGRVRICVSVHK